MLQNVPDAEQLQKKWRKKTLSYSPIYFGPSFDSVCVFQKQMFSWSIFSNAKRLPNDYFILSIQESLAQDTKVKSELWQ